ncbi:MAG: hypothetical protein RSD67_08180 [Oscillospiraceae bacterium]
MILKIKGDWQDVVDDCRSTVNKPPLNKEPSDKFKRDIMISEHSPIRDISIRWKWCDIPYWLSTEFSRHKFEKFITTQRTDRTGESRDKKPQDSPVDFVGDANSQHLIDMMRKRLCVGCASNQAYQKAIELKQEITNVVPELGNVLVPNCVYRCGCPEINGCAYFDKFSLWVVSNNYNLFDIQSRYNAYNTYIERK